MVGDAEAIVIPGRNTTRAAMPGADERELAVI
jgi:hypothetical protein